MVQIGENQQKHLTAHHAAMQFLRTDLTGDTVIMFISIINVPGRKESAP